MASLTSDRNRDLECGLGYGTSHVFEKNVCAQQKVKSAKLIKNQVMFSDPKDHKNYKRMLDDIMYKTFDGPEEQKLLKKSLEGMKRDYPDILSGNKRNMFFYPPAFDFDSRIKT